MESAAKLIKKHFKGGSIEALLERIEKSPEEMFEANFFTTKANYLTMIKTLINEINQVGAEYSNYIEMAKPGSILYGSATSTGVASIQKKYRLDRKNLVNHARFFLKEK